MRASLAASLAILLVAAAPAPAAAQCADAALRFDGDFTPYAALQLERSLRRSQPFNWFGHIGAGYEFLQIDIGVSIAH